MYEEILDPKNKKLSLYPIKYPDIFEMYKKIEASFWTVEEVDLNGDKKQFDVLKDNEKYYLENILAFFANADGIVNENLSVNFADEIQIAEARAFYTFQEASETVHNEMYCLLIETYISSEEKKKELYNSVVTNPFIKKKSEWAMNWFDRSRPFAQRIVAFACVEGIFFSSSFAGIFWFKKRCLLPGLCFSNELISKDEALHCKFACLIYKKCNNKIPKEIFYQIIDSAVQLEIEFVEHSIPSGLIGINSDLMSKYIKFCADYWTIEMGYEKLYNVKNPFDFMDQISLDGKANFFEKNVSSYSLFGVGVDKEQMVFRTDEDF